MSNNSIIQLEDGWSVIKRAIDDVLIKALNDGVEVNCSPAEYLRIYTLFYDMCTQRDPYNWIDHMYQRHGVTIEQYLHSTVLPSLQDKSDQDQGGGGFLNELRYRWSNHQTMNQWMGKFFCYLDRYYVKQNSLPSLKEKGLQLFKTEIYQPFKGHATSTIICLINEEREGGTIDKTLIKSIIGLYESMGMGVLDLYTYDLEQPLLDATRVYYSGNMKSLYTKFSISACLAMAEEALDKEKTRVVDYLNPATEPKILGQIRGLITYYKLKDAMVNLELALWKARINEENGQDRDMCHVGCGAEIIVKGVLQFL